jgi:hypothetical protein
MKSGLICPAFAASMIPAVANAQLTVDMGRITHAPKKCFLPVRLCIEKFRS